MVKKKILACFFKEVASVKINWYIIGNSVDTVHYP